MRSRQSRLQKWWWYRTEERKRRHSGETEAQAEARKLAKILLLTRGNGPLMPGEAKQLIRMLEAKTLYHPQVIRDAVGKYAGKVGRISQAA